MLGTKKFRLNLLFLVLLIIMIDDKCIFPLIIYKDKRFDIHLDHRKDPVFHLKLPVLFSDIQIHQAGCRHDHCDHEYHKHTQAGHQHRRRSFYGLNIAG